MDLSFGQKYDFTAVYHRCVRTMSKLGIDQSDVNDLFGIDSSLPFVDQVACWPAPSMQVIAKLSDFFGVSVPYLLTGKVTNEVDFIVTKEIDFLGEVEVLKAFRKLPANKKLEAISFLSDLAR